MPTSTLLALGVKSAGKATFNKLFLDTLSSLKINAKSLLSKRQIDHAIKKFYTHISKVRLVKTLWQMDKPVDLGTFYCEAHVEIGAERKKITSLADISNYNALVIEGIAGQGKSIFLRYLCSVELVSSKYIPVFIELRRVRKNVSLLEQIRSTLEEFGLKVTIDQLNALMQSARVLLLLDAFDEVVEEDKQWLIDEIEHLAKCHQDALRIVITSRPQSGIQVSAIFHVVKLSDLLANEYELVVFRLLEDTATAGELIKRVQSHGAAVKDLLKTPLLVTLLVINYKASQEIPEQLSAFYDDLFKLLLQRHDGTKPGYRRQRLCKLNDSEYRRVFEALCFLVSNRKRGALNHTTMITITQEAFKAVRISEDPEHFLSDIIKITCLIVKDGEEYRFIHKSVQEYYAACFIKTKPDLIAKRIYNHMFSEITASWHHELEFLSEIDTYRFHKFGLLPAICKYLKITPNDLSKTQPIQVQPAILEHVCETTVILSPNGNDDLPDAICLLDFIPTIYSANVSPLYSIDYSPALNAAANKTISSTAWDKIGKSSKVGFEVNYGDILKAHLMVEEIGKATLEIASNLIAAAKASASQIDIEEKDELSLTSFLD